MIGQNGSANEYAPIDPGIPSPFATTALGYLAKGWHPLPLYVSRESDPKLPDRMRYRMKGNPVTGFTGYRGADADRHQIEIWAGIRDHFNFCLRLPVNVVAIDVDDHDGKGGLATLRMLERKLGPLPQTLFNTARADGSGHLLFRVPGKRVWKNPGPGIEICAWHIRYIVAPPSIHPQLGTPYAWHMQTASGNVPYGSAVPDMDDIPELPAAWVKFLDTGRDPEKAGQRVELGPDAAAELFAGWNRDGEVCEHLTKVVDQVLSTPPGGHHDAAMRAQVRLVRLGEQGHPGAGAAITTLGEWASEGLRGGDEEWRRGLISAVEMIAAEPTAQGLRGCTRTVQLRTKIITLKGRTR